MAEEKIEKYFMGNFADREELLSMEAKDVEVLRTLFKEFSSELHVELDQRFDQIDQRFEAMDQKIDNNFEILNQKIDSRSEFLLKEIERNNRELQTSINSLNNKIDDIDVYYRIRRVEDSTQADLLKLYNRLDSKVDDLCRFKEDTTKVLIENNLVLDK